MFKLGIIFFITVVSAGFSTGSYQVVEDEITASEGSIKNQSEKSGKAFGSENGSIQKILESTNFIFFGLAQAPIQISEGIHVWTSETLVMPSVSKVSEQGGTDQDNKSLKSVRKLVIDIITHDLVRLPLESTLEAVDIYSYASGDVYQWTKVKSFGSVDFVVDSGLNAISFSAGKFQALGKWSEANVLGSTLAASEILGALSRGDTEQSKEASQKFKTLFSEVVVGPSDLIVASVSAVDKFLQDFFSSLNNSSEGDISKAPYIVSLVQGTKKLLGKNGEIYLLISKASQDWLDEPSTDASLTTLLLPLDIVTTSIDVYSTEKEGSESDLIE